MVHAQLDLEFQLRQYKSYHREKTNVFIHMIFVPTIFFSSSCIFHRINLGHGITLAHIQSAIFSLYYIFLCLEPGLLASTLLLTLNWSLDKGKIRLHLYQEISLFVIGWIVQFIGHSYFECRRPALMDNLTQSLITAPYFVFFELLFKLGFYKRLQTKLES